jgi:hypothetical protein
MPGVAIARESRRIGKAVGIRQQSKSLFPLKLTYPPSAVLASPNDRARPDWTPRPLSD